MLEGVELKHLDAELFEGAGATKRDLVEHVRALAGPLVAELHGRPLTVTRVRPGQRPFVQKNLPGSAPGWVDTRDVWAEASHRTVRYPLAEDARTLVWLAGQRAVELHPTVLDGDGAPIPGTGNQTQVWLCPVSTGSSGSPSVMIWPRSRSRSMSRLV